MPQTALNIVQEGDPVLRDIAKEVAKTDLGSTKLQRVIRDMRTALETCEDGVAIAAPQIGVALRIFVVSWRAFAIEKGIEELETMRGKFTDMVFINPEITKRSRKKNTVPEGCLSVRWLYGNVARADKVTIRAYDEQGKLFTYGGAGLMAQIFQHETDHLNGILFIDSATDLEEIPPETVDALKKAKKKAQA